MSLRVPKPTIHVAIVASALLVGLAPACSRRTPEPNPMVAASATTPIVATASSRSSISGGATSGATGAAAAISSTGGPTSAIASASGSTSASGSASTSASASSSTSSSAWIASPAGALVEKSVGIWVFSRFDLDDPDTKARWEPIPAEQKKEVLDAAPEAILEITRDALVMRLLGVPDHKSAFTVDPMPVASKVGGPFDTVTLMSTEGRKRIRVVDDQTLRIEELDKKDSFVAYFTRKKADPAPVVSATSKGS